MADRVKVFEEWSTRTCICQEQKKLFRFFDNFSSALVSWDTTMVAVTYYFTHRHLWSPIVRSGGATHGSVSGCATIVPHRNK